MRDLHRPVAALALLAGAAACTNGVTFPARDNLAFVPSRPNTSGQASAYGATAPGAPGGTSTRPIQSQTSVLVVDRGPRTDGQILETLAALERREVELSRVAERRSMNGEVRSFASSLLERRRQSTNERARYVSHTNVAYQPTPQARDVREDTSESKDELATLSGADLDAEYLDEIVRSKEEALEFIDNQALDRATDERLHRSLRRERTLIERELRAARALQERLEDRGSI